MTKASLVGALVLIAFVMLTLAIMAMAPWIAALMIIGFVIWISSCGKAPRE